MPHKIGPIERGERSLISDAESLGRSSRWISTREDDALIAAVESLELECRRLADQAREFAALMRRLPRCPLCGHANDTDQNPHADCVEEALAAAA